MKKIIVIATLSSFFAVSSCKKENPNLWKTEIDAPIQKVEITDISSELYNPSISLEEFKAKYPWFQGSNTDEAFEARRKDADEIKIYKEAISKIDINKLNKDLAALFSRVKFYFPEFKTPKVNLYSSALQMATEPIFLQPEANMLFIDVTGFMGEKNANYKGLDLYIQKSMNPSYIIPKVSEILAENLVPYNGDHQKFIDELIYNGKLMTLQDAFLPNEPDYLKINYTQKQYDWAKSNEANIWNFFVENDLLFSDDQRLNERFIKPGPFSKFYTEIDNQSSPQIGIFTGWQICRAFFNEKPETKLQDFLKMNSEQIFNESNYKPQQ